MKDITKNDQLFLHRVLFNGYHCVNECSKNATFLDIPQKKYDNNLMYYDEYYGRFYEGRFLNNVSAVYGNPDSFYNHGAIVDLPVVDQLQVPYRLIPIYKANNCLEIQEAIKQMERKNPNYKILLRGQKTIHFLKRSENEKNELYGSSNIKEPSFLPTFQRQKLDYHKTVSVWHNVCAILLDELSKEDSNLLNFRNIEGFHLLALGLAQHYGLPSIGLDLTDDLLVALWFAIFNAHYSNTAPVSAELISDNDKEATIFVFRCPELSIFKYPDIEIAIGAHRPIAQKAYFNHCGWGLAKNELALNLACGFRVDSSFARELPDNYIRTLFPPIDKDKVLRTLLKIKDLYQGTELEEMLESIYL